VKYLATKNVDRPTAASRRRFDLAVAKLSTFFPIVYASSFLRPLSCHILPTDVCLSVVPAIVAAKNG
jgi:hypothetical protein